ncbi:MAG: NTP transferase domain-containing protein, partial [Bdellovibrionales bacterium]|nr:NTP transferase domain-containing protein [Bdellovibrionales bacterium]
EQKNDQHIIEIEKIEDKFTGFGPTGGIISAMHEYPEAAWLVIACDLPYLNRSTLANLVDQRNGFKLATCYNNPEKNWPEPLCTIYEPKAVDKLGMYLMNQRPCPRKVLFNSNINKIELKTKNALDNINNEEQFKLAKEFINNTGVPLYES